MPVVIDHLILALSPEDHERLTPIFAQAGFVDVEVKSGHPAESADEGVATAAGVVNRLIGFSGGAAIELLRADDSDNGVHDVWFDETPRIQGVGFTTDTYDEQTAPWTELPDSWNSEFKKTFDDGTDGSFRAAGPMKHLAKFYPFVMKRETAPFLEGQSDVRLRSVTFAGKNSKWWEERIPVWFLLTKLGHDWITEDLVVFSFVDGEHEDIRVSVAFDVPGESVSIPLSFGASIELVGASSGSAA